MTENLEEKTLEIDINGTGTNITQIEGTVSYVLGRSEPIIVNGNKVGYQKVLSVTVNTFQERRKRRFTFKGDSPIEVGDSITVGIVLGRETEDPKSIYIAKWDHSGRRNHHLYLRIDYANGYNLSDEDRKKIVFW